MSLPPGCRMGRARPRTAAAPAVVHPVYPFMGSGVPSMGWIVQRDCANCEFLHLCSPRRALRAISAGTVSPLFLMLTQLLTPYKSLILLTADEAECQELVPRFLRNCIDLFIERELGLELASQPIVERRDILELGLLHLVQQETASWTNEEGIRDTYNHLVAIFRFHTYFALHVSDGRLRDIIAGQLGNSTYSALASLGLVDWAVMNAAYIQGAPRTLWLSGIHPRTALKSDSKTLSGMDLRDALDPLADQSYHFTAIRCEFEDGTIATPIGVSPHKSRIWLSSSKSWDEFLDSVLIILTRLSETRTRSFVPVPYLSVPGLGGVDVTGAFDVGFRPPISAEDPAALNPWDAELERIADEIYFSIADTDGADFAAEILNNGSQIGSLYVRVDLTDAGGVVVHAEGEPVGAATEGLMRDVIRYCEQGDLLTIRYDSEHVVSGGKLFRPRYRDYFFGGFRWDPFDAIAITKEKPTTLQQIGFEDSLFCWVRKKWVEVAPHPTSVESWLACDDGSGEMADFIHYDPENDALCLIHVKASGKAVDRGVAVTKFDVVTNQAIKNLRFLDSRNLGERLSQRITTQAADLVWQGGIAADRAALIDALTNISPRTKKKVIIVQPHLHKDVVDRASEHPDGAEAARMRQLNMLLLSAQTACRSLNADLLVYGQGTPD
jgi:hypothetical protein